MKNTIPWILFFLVCMGVGFLHGVLPQGLSRSLIQTPTKLQILTTDELLFPEATRKKIETEMHVKLSVTVTRNWDDILAHVVASPGVDLIFLPSFWAETFAHQNLLADVSGPSDSLRTRLAPDFKGKAPAQEFYFLPMYWMKTGIETSENKSFQEFLQNKNQNILFLLADEDLILNHFRIWKEQGLWEKVSSKKILTLQLDQILQEDTRLGAVEGPIHEELPENKKLDRLSALLIWGAAIPASAPHKAESLELLDLLTNVEHQESTLLQTPFNSTFATVSGDSIPLQRRAEFVRNLRLKDTLILDKKEKDAQVLLRNDFNFTF